MKYRSSYRDFQSLYKDKYLYGCSLKFYDNMIVDTYKKGILVQLYSATFKIEVSSCSVFSVYCAPVTLILRHCDCKWQI